MEQPKFGVGQEVEVPSDFNAKLYYPGVIQGITPTYTYTVTLAGSDTQRDYPEDQMHDPRSSEEEAWKKTMLLIGRRSGERDYRIGEEAFDKETRHQCYIILGRAGIKITNKDTDKVKAEVRRLIEIADSL